MNINGNVDNKLLNSEVVLTAARTDRAAGLSFAAAALIIKIIIIVIILIMIITMIMIIISIIMQIMLINHANNVNSVNHADNANSALVHTILYKEFTRLARN